MKGRNSIPVSMKQNKLLLNPEPLKELPPIPDGLDEYAAKSWEDMGGLLIQEKILTEFDLTLLRHYCVLNSLCIRYETYICDVDSPIFGKGQTGLLRQNPFVRQYQDVGKQMLQVAEHFGMTPKARGKVGIKSPTADIEQDELKKFNTGKQSYGKDDIGLD